MKKNTLLKLSLLTLATLSPLKAFSEYKVVIIRDEITGALKIERKADAWTTIASKFIEWVDPDSNDPLYRYECSNWAPTADTVEQGKTFTQTATDCKSSQFAKMIAQEQNTVTSEIRDKGIAYIDNSNTKVLTGKTSSRTQTGTRSGFLTIINPVAGKNGIYKISDGAGSTFNAYVNMTDAGGYWVLSNRWTNSPVRLNYNQVIVKDYLLSTTTNDTANYPVIPSGKYKNNSDMVMFVNENSSWTSMFGKWQTFGTVPTNYVMTRSGLSANTPLGPKTIYSRSLAWPSSNKGTMDEMFGIWNVDGNGGVCGGENTVGTNKMCAVLLPITDNYHYDITSNKWTYLKAKN